VERLVEHPLRPGASLWLSGDLARWDADFLLHHAGRADRQLKIRGMRVEPGEIEAALRSHHDVADAAVVPVDGPDGRALVAHVLPTAGATPEPAALRAHVAELVPPHMVPWRLLVTTELPQIGSGKLDRAWLALDTNQARERSRRMNERERRIAELFQELLGLPERPSRDDDFFELGGHSLLAIRLMVSLEHRLGLQLTLASLIQAPTPAGVAAAAKPDDSRERAARSPVVEVVAVDGDVALFVISGVFGMPWIARRIGRLMEPRGPIYGFEAFGHHPGERPLQSVEEIAKAYASAVRAVRQGRRVVLVGFCFGGHVALEIARVLREAGETVDGLVVVDVGAVTVAPRQLPRSVRWQRAWRRRLDRTGRGLQRRVENAGRRMRGIRPPDERRRRRVRCAHETAAARYATRPLDVDLVLLRTQNDFGWYRGQWDYGWGAFVRNVELVPLETMHAEMTNEGADVTAHALQAIVDDVARS
jgi:thioesterase domain-containing protein/acyl carrier protein